MIPKKIHYSWFGPSPFPVFAKKYIDSWKKYCPDYQFCFWNEKNYNINAHDFTMYTARNKQWGFLNDYARFDIVRQHGGIYLDIDVELIQNLDRFLTHSFFAGFQDRKYVATGLIFGAEAEHRLLKMWIEQYDLFYQQHAPSSPFQMTGPAFQTEILLRRYGLQECDGIHIQTVGDETCVIYPPEYFCPIDYETRETNFTANTCSVHHWAGTWISTKSRRKKRIVKILNKISPQLVPLIIRMKHFLLSCVHSKSIS